MPQQTDQRVFEAVSHSRNSRPAAIGSRPSSSLAVFRLQLPSNRPLKFPNYYRVGERLADDRKTVLPHIYCQGTHALSWNLDTGEARMHSTARTRGSAATMAGLHNEGRCRSRLGEALLSHGLPELV